MCVIARESVGRVEGVLSCRVVISRRGFGDLIRLLSVHTGTVKAIFLCQVF